MLAGRRAHGEILRIFAAVVTDPTMVYFSCLTQEDGSIASQLPRWLILGCPGDMDALKITVDPHCFPGLDDAATEASSLLQRWAATKASTC